MEEVSGFTYEFLSWRGIDASTFKIYGTLTKIDATGRPISIGLRYPNGSYQVRLKDKKEFFWIGEHKPGLFGTDKFAAGSHKHVIVTEGALDAHSYFQAVRCPCVSVQSASSALRDCTVDFDYLNSFERIYFALDSDTAGREAVRSCAKLFAHDKVFDIKFSNRKDANEYTINGEEDELRNIWKNSRKYLPDELVSSLSKFKSIVTTPTKAGVPYPFQCLTDKTYGIRTGETVLVLAQEKVGKTELMHILEHKLLKETLDNVGAIFLEEPQKRHLEALAGIELRRPVHLPDSGCTDNQILSALDQVVGKDDRLFIYSHFGGVDPESLLDTIRFLVVACNCAYVILDHITMGVVGSTRVDDERRTLEYLATRLEMMVKELDFALIIVSHVNDIGQSRGSHYLTKVADITIRIERDLMSADKERQNTWILSIPYNRFCGKTGYAGEVVFDPEAYSYREIANV